MRMVWMSLLVVAGAVGTAEGQVGEVTGLTFSSAAAIGWNPVDAADHYHVYRATEKSAAGRCHGYRVAGPGFDTPAIPEPAGAFYFLVTGESEQHGEGPPGAGSDDVPRPLLGSCGSVMRTHVLDRIGYGWNEYVGERIDAIGLDAFLAEQLDPGAISEAGNTDLENGLALYDPPADIIGLLARQVIRSVHARRQLDQAYAMFWANHFNTYWAKLATLLQAVFPACQSPGSPQQCDENFPQAAYRVATEMQHRELSTFRRLGFDGSFREIVEASAKSSAMIIFLDTYTSLAGNPNENFPRELLELYAMGVDGGYTQTDVEELSRVFTGWTVCKKTLANLGDPLAPCISSYWEPLPEGLWVAHFVPANHDCTEKTLFEGTAHERTIPDTCAAPSQGAADVDLALDAIVDHPATARFISRKILERFVTDAPTAAMVDALVTTWSDASNPDGVGDLSAVLERAFDLDAFRDPDRVGSKIKTPYEHMAAALRGTRGRTDGATVVLDFLVRTGHIPFYNPVPTGWPESGDAWIGTNNYLERQSYGYTLLTSAHPFFGADPLNLLVDHGISTGPGNAAAIVDFFSERFFGGALTPAERQKAITYLDTDVAGEPAPYDDVRIRETVALLLGFPHFQEQ